MSSPCSSLLTSLPKKCNFLLNSFSTNRGNNMTRIKLLSTVVLVCEAVIQSASCSQALCTAKDSARLLSSPWQIPAFPFQGGSDTCKEVDMSLLRSLWAYEWLVILSCIIMVLNEAWTRSATLAGGRKTLEKEQHLPDWQPLMKKRHSKKTLNKTTITQMSSCCQIIRFANKWLDVFYSTEDICVKCVVSFMWCHHRTLS